VVLKIVYKKQCEVEDFYYSLLKPLFHFALFYVLLTIQEFFTQILSFDFTETFFDRSHILLTIFHYINHAIPLIRLEQVNLDVHLTYSNLV